MYRHETSYRRGRGAAPRASPSPASCTATVTPSPSSNAIPPPTPVPRAARSTCTRGWASSRWAKAGLLAGFRALSRPEGQAMRIRDTDGTVLRDWRPPSGRPGQSEIDRGATP
ncbi:hypothetical protein GCM10018952_19650 [Streptosporangium vulgare]